MGGRDGGSEAAPALAQRAGGDPDLVSFPGCSSVGVGGLEVWHGEGPCSGAKEVPQPPLRLGRGGREGKREEKRGGRESQ